MSTTLYQASHDLMCQLLRKVLVDGVQAGRGAVGGIGSIRCRVSGALYALLMDHPVDQQGFCRSCRGPGAVFGRRYRCWVHKEASYWLRQPEEFLHSRVREWELVGHSPPGADVAPDRGNATRAADLDDTEVLARIELELNDSPTQPFQTSAVSSPLAPSSRGDRG